MLCPLQDLQRVENVLLHRLFGFWRISTHRCHPPVPPPSLEADTHPWALRLHDDIGQWLALAMLQIDGTRATRPDLHEELAPLRASLRHAAQALHDMIHEQRATMPPPHLLAAIERTLSNSPWVDYPLKRRLDSALSRMPTATAPLATRVIAELVSNAHRHAQAQHVALHVRRMGRQLHIRIRDNGIGMADESTRQHFGLRSLRSQIANQGGRMLIFAKPNIGTRIDVVLPLKRNSRLPCRRLVASTKP